MPALSPDSVPIPRHWPHITMVRSRSKNAISGRVTSWVARVARRSLRISQRLSRSPSLRTSGKAVWSPSEELLSPAPLLPPLPCVQAPSTPCVGSGSFLRVPLPLLSSLGFPCKHQNLHL